jgi:hypothetical protein
VNFIVSKIDDTPVDAGLMDRKINGFRNFGVAYCSPNCTNRQQVGWAILINGYRNVVICHIGSI